MRPDDLVGTLLELQVGPVAHGGHCVARHDGQVVFVRHALPGEVVRAAVTEQTAKYLRADAVEVLQPSPHRVQPPCPYAGPGLCGGCDFQHVALPAQRHLKAAVVAEQLRRLAGIERAVVVEPVDTAEARDGLRWRTRMQYVHLPDGRRGLRRHRSHDVVPIAQCLIAHPGAREPNEGTVREAVVTGAGSHDFEVAADGFWHFAEPVAMAAD